MIINNIEIKHGDYILGFAKDIISYHYTMAFAFIVDYVDEDTIKCVFYEYYSNDGRASLFVEDKTITKYDFYGLMMEDIIGVFSPDYYEKFVDILMEESLDEMNMFEIFNEFLEKAITCFNEI